MFWWPASTRGNSSDSPAKPAKAANAQDNRRAAWIQQARDGNQPPTTPAMAPIAMLAAKNVLKPRARVRPLVRPDVARMIETVQAERAGPPRNAEENNSARPSAKQRTAQSA